MAVALLCDYPHLPACLFKLDGAEWSSMDVVVELTDAGVEHVWDVIKAVYAYLHMMRQEGVQVMGG